MEPLYIWSLRRRTERRWSIKGLKKIMVEKFPNLVKYITKGFKKCCEFQTR